MLTELNFAVHYNKEKQIFIVITDKGRQEFKEMNDVLKFVLQDSMDKLTLAVFQECPEKLKS